jgi:hypothetical protein
MPRSRAPRWLAESALALGVTLLLAHTHVWPLDRVVQGDVGGDYGQLTWNFWWMTKRLLLLENPFRAPEVYYPVGAYLTKHTYSFGFFPVGLAARALVADPGHAALVAYRGSLLLAYAGGLLLAFHALVAMGARAGPAAAGAVAYVFSSFFAAHLPLISIAASALVVPATTLAFARLVRRPSAGSALVLALVAGAGVYLSEFSVFALVGVAVAVATAVAWRETRAEALAVARAVGWRGFVLAWTALLLLAMPFVVNWGRDEGKAPKAAAAGHWTVRPIDLVVPDRGLIPAYRYRAPLLHEEHWGFRGYGQGGVFLGYPALLFGLGGAFLVERRRRMLLLSVALAFLVLSLGPALDLGPLELPLPFALLREVPPFQMMRTPMRFASLAQWALCGLLALGLSGLSERLEARGRRRLALALVALALAWALAEGFRSVLRIEPFAPPPELADLAEGPVVNLPLQVMDGHAMFLQIWHVRPILTGYLSRRSPAQVEHVRELQRAYDAGPGSFEQALLRHGCRSVIAGSDVSDDEIARLRTTSLRVLDLRRLK